VNVVGLASSIRVLSDAVVRHSAGLCPHGTLGTQSTMADTLPDGRRGERWDPFDPGEHGTRPAIMGLPGDAHSAAESPALLRARFTGSFETAQPKFQECHGRHEAQFSICAGDANAFHLPWSGREGGVSMSDYEGLASNMGAAGPHSTHGSARCPIDLGAPYARRTPGVLQPRASIRRRIVLWSWAPLPPSS
jgi:hypothetical protein